MFITIYVYIHVSICRSGNKLYAVKATAIILWQKCGNYIGGNQVTAIKSAAIFWRQSSVVEPKHHLNSMFIVRNHSSLSDIAINICWRHWLQMTSNRGKLYISINCLNCCTTLIKTMRLEVYSTFTFCTDKKQTIRGNKCKLFWNYIRKRIFVCNMYLSALCLEDFPTVEKWFWVSSKKK